MPNRAAVSDAELLSRCARSAAAEDLHADLAGGAFYERAFPASMTRFAPILTRARCRAAMEARAPETQRWTWPSYLEPGTGLQRPGWSRLLSFTSNRIRRATRRACASGWSTSPISGVTYHPFHPLPEAGRDFGDNRGGLLRVPWIIYSRIRPALGSLVGFRGNRRCLSAPLADVAPESTWSLNHTAEEFGLGRASCARGVRPIPAITT